MPLYTIDVISKTNFSNLCRRGVHDVISVQKLKEMEHNRQNPFENPSEENPVE